MIRLRARRARAMGRVPLRPAGACQFQAPARGRKPIRLLFALALCASAGASGAYAQPLIAYGGVMNDASHGPAGLPAAAIAPGSRFTIQGTGLGPATPVTADSFPLGLTLGGVSVVAVTAGGTAYNCYPFYVSATAVRAMLTNTAPAGPLAIKLTYQGQTSNSSTVTVSAVSPGLYSVSANGEGPGQASDVATANGKLISSTTAGGKPLTTASILATGLGAISQSDTTAPPQQNIPGDTVSVTVGGQSAARVLYFGRSTKQPGADQVIFQVPSTAPLGCYVPVQIVVNGTPSNLVTVALSSNGTACSDPGNPGSTALAGGGNLALMGLIRTDTLIAASNFIVDRGVTMGIQTAANPFAYLRSISLPPPGACTVYMNYGDVQIATLSFNLAGTVFNPGTLNITGPSGGATLTANSPALLGVQGATLTPNPGPPYLAPGTYTLQSSGSAPVGPYTVSFNLNQPLTWTNRASIQTVTRSAGVTVQWSGAGSRQVVVTGTAYTPDYSASAMFFCLAPAGAASFTVPPAVLGLLPAVQLNRTPPLGVLGLGTFAANTPTTFAAASLTSGVATVLAVAGQPVQYR
jgi:uncharacterized protein (TIGR03437 family)